MVSAEARKAAAAASVPKDAITSKQKSEARIAANITRGGFVSQKERALKSGGKFSEGGSVTQVNILDQPPQKRQPEHHQVFLDERLGFSDSLETSRVITKRVGSGNSSPSASAAIFPKTITKQKKKGKDLSVNLKESFGFGEPQTQKRIGAVAPFGGAFTAGFDLFKTKKDDFIGPRRPKEGFDKFFDDLTFAGESAKELGKQLFSDLATSKELQFGAGFVGTLGGTHNKIRQDQKTTGRVAVVTPEAKSLEKFIVSNYAPNEFEQKVVEGKFSEIDLDDPKTLGQSLKFPTYILGPAGVSKGVKFTGEALGAVASKTSKKAANTFNQFFRDIGASPGQRVGGEFDMVKNPGVTLIPKEGGKNEFKAFERFTKKEKPFKKEETLISTGGTEQFPDAIRILKTGKFPDPITKAKRPGSIFFNPKIKNPVTELTPSISKAPVNPLKEINIQGFLSKSDLKALGAQATGRSGKATIFSKPKDFIGPVRPKPVSIFNVAQTDKASRATFNQLVSSGKAVQTAEGITAPLKDITSGKNIRQRLGLNTNVFVQTKAEKAAFKKVFGPSKKGPQTPFDKGPFSISDKGAAGGRGRAKNVFDQPTVKNILETETAKAKSKTIAKTEMDILFKGPRFKQSAGGFISPSLPSFQTPQTKQKARNFGGLSFQDEISLTINPRKTKPKNEFNVFFSENLGFKQGGKKKQGQTLLGGLTFKDELSTLTGRTPKQKDKERFIFREDFNYKLTPGGKLDIPDDPPPPPPPFRDPIPEEFPKLGGAFFGRPISLSEFTGEGRASSKKVFGAFGISTNINVGRLPGPLSEFSTSSKVFTKLDKRDKKFQDELFGIRKRKSKKGKTKKRKSKSKRKRR